jgi:hypothetical protein
MCARRRPCRSIGGFGWRDCRACRWPAAHAEYKEVWNPPEAAQGVKHSKHAAPVDSGAANSAHRDKVAPKVKVTLKPKASPEKKASGAAIKTARASAAPRKAALAKPAAASVKPAAPDSPALQAGNASTPRELPPIIGR